MKLRFKIRTLLICTALIAVFLGLQVHVHNKASKFLEEMRSESSERTLLLTRDFDTDDYRVEYASMLPLSFWDVVYLQRRCEVSLSATFSMSGEDGKVVTQNVYSYPVTCFGEINYDDVSSVSAFHLNRR